MPGKPYLTEKGLLSDMNTLQRLGFVASPFPLLSGVLSTAGNIQELSQDESSRNPLNYGLMAMDAAPVVQALAGVAKTGKEMLKQAPRVFHRYTRTANPASRGGHMLFSDNLDSVSNNYGPYRWSATDEGAVDVKKLLPDFERALKGYPEIVDSYIPEGALSDNAKLLAQEFDPDDIVNSAGGWDAEDLVELLYNDVLAPKGIDKVLTRNGLVVFDPDTVKAVVD